MDRVALNVIIEYETIFKQKQLALSFHRSLEITFPFLGYRCKCLLCIIIGMCPCCHCFYLFFPCYMKLLSFLYAHFCLFCHCCMPIDVNPFSPLLFCQYSSLCANFCMLLFCQFSLCMHTFADLSFVIV